MPWNNRVYKHGKIPKTTDLVGNRDSLQSTKMTRTFLEVYIHVHFYGYTVLVIGTHIVTKR